MHGAVAADQADQQRDVTCDNSPKGSEEGDSGKDMKRRGVCTSAAERPVVKANWKYRHVDLVPVIVPTTDGVC